jgi:hypothetical protein
LNSGAGTCTLDFSSRNIPSVFQIQMYSVYALNKSTTRYLLIADGSQIYPLGIIVVSS